MYLAQALVNGVRQFFLRESYLKDKVWFYRELFALGPDPSVFINYPGGNSFYIDESVEKGIRQEGGVYDEDKVEQLLMSFVDPHIQEVVARFTRSDFRKSPHVGSDERQRIAEEIHIFDRRRLHYLKYGALDQGRIYQAPDKLFHVLLSKSRDELEQYFMREEMVLASGEQKQYVYVITNLQRHFQEFAALLAPAALPGAKVDGLLVKELCALDQNKKFWAGFERDSIFHPYLQRYLIMYFDGVWPEIRASEEYVRRFVNEHRSYRPPVSQQVKIKKGSVLFGASWNELRSMSQRQLTRLYRKKVHDLHPDKGGDKDDFVALTDLYNALSERKK